MVESSQTKNSLRGVKKMTTKGNSPRYVRFNKMEWWRGRIRPLWARPLCEKNAKGKEFAPRIMGETVNTCVYVLNRSSTKSL